MLDVNYFYYSRNYLKELHSALTTKEKNVLIRHLNEKILPSVSDFLDKNLNEIFKLLMKTPAERSKVKKWNDEKDCYKHYLIMFSFMYGLLGCINIKIISNLYEHGSYRRIFSAYSQLIFPSFTKEVYQLFFKDFDEVEDYINAY